MSVRAIEAEVSIKSGVQAECTIGREVIVEVHEEVNLESLTATANGEYIPAEGIDGYDRVVVNVPPTIPDIAPLMVTDDGTYTASGDGYNPVVVNTGVASLRSEIQSAKTASGCDPLTEGITALTTYANEATGAEDETLSDAVETLISKMGESAKSIKVTAPTDIIQNAALIYNWLTQVVPSSSIAIVLRDNFVYDRETTKGRGTFLLAIIFNNVPKIAMRFYISLGNITTWGSNMWLSVDAGDTYTILYVE